MKYLHQILLIFLFSFLGELLHALIPWPIPASIYGMVLLFLALALRIIPVGAVKAAGTFLTTSLPVLFVVPIVSLLDCWDMVKDHLISIFVICIASTVICFAAAGWITQWFVRRKGDQHG